MKEERFKEILEQRFKNYINYDILPMSGVWFSSDDNDHHKKITQRSKQLVDIVMTDINAFLIYNFKKNKTP